MCVCVSVLWTKTVWFWEVGWSAFHISTHGEMEFRMWVFVSEQICFSMNHQRFMVFIRLCSFRGSPQ